MAEVAVSALDGRSQQLVENARAALERGNVGYALEACAEVLSAAPGCVAARRLQRIAQLKRFRHRNRLLAKMAGGWRWVSFSLRRRKWRLDEQWSAAEKWIAVDPTSPAALTWLGEVALEREMPETAVFAFEAARELRPEDTENLVALGEAWLAAGRATEAVGCADVVLARQPAHAGAQALMRMAAIAQTLAEGRWEERTSFREKLR